MKALGDPMVDTAVARLAARDRDQAAAATAAFESLTFGQGLDQVYLLGLCEWLWYQLPAKWLCPLSEHLELAAALGALFQDLGRPRHAELCRSTTTERVLKAWDRGHGEGRRATRAALDGSGVQPPDVPGLIAWGGVVGSDESRALGTAALRLESAIEAGELRPGARGWRAAAQRITAAALTEGQPPTLLERVQRERLESWSRSRGDTRHRLTAMIAGQLAMPVSMPEDAEHRLAPVRWLLRLAASGVPLTQNCTLARAVVADGADRFDWLTLARGRVRSETDVIEVHTLRALLREIGAVRRQGRRLLLTEAGRRLHEADTAGLWDAVTAALIPADQAQAAAAEAALMLLLTAPAIGYREHTAHVAEVLAGEGWRDDAGTPVDAKASGWLEGELHRRLRLLGLLQPRPLGESDRLSEAGRTAAHAALRARALGSHTSR